MEEFEVHIESSNKYWKQALENLEAGHYDKASELIWGSITIRIKALALRRTKSYIETHR